MNHQRIGLGILAMFLGVAVPLAHHAALFAAFASSRSGVVVSNINDIFRYLPWIDWAYLTFMTVVAVVLVVSGMFSRPATPTS